MFRVKVHNRIEQIISFLHRVRIWHRGDEATVAEKRFKLFYSIYYFLLPVSLIAGALDSDNKDERVFLIEAAIMTVVLLVKLLYLIWRKKEICEQLNRICDFDVEDQPTFTEINDKLNCSMKFVAILFSLSYICAICVGLVVPLMGDEKALFFNIGFPFDYKNNEFAYWSAFLFIFTQMIVTIISTLFSIIAWYLIANCSLRYEAVGQQIRVMGEIKSVDVVAIEIKISNAQRDNLYEQDLFEAIASHQHLEELTKQLHSFLSDVFVIQLATSALCICASIYCLAFYQFGNLIENIIFITSLLYNLSDILVIMYFGNDLQLASDRLSYCLFQSNWVDRSQSIKKNVLIFGEFLMKPHQLIVLKLYSLNLETFMRILNSAYSMFNILQNLK